MTVCAPVKSNSDSATEEVRNIENYASRNRMTLNLSKTWEMLLSSGYFRRRCLPLGLTYMLIDGLLSKAGSRMYILRVCRRYGYQKEHLSYLFDSIILSLFLYGIEIWGSALQKKYLDRIDKFF